MKHMKSKFLFGVGLTILSVFLLSVIWEFVFEPWIQSGAVESFDERFEYIFTSLAFLLCGLVFPVIFGLN